MKFKVGDCVKLNKNNFAIAIYTNRFAFIIEERQGKYVIDRDLYKGDTRYMYKDIWLLPAKQYTTKLGKILYGKKE